MIYIGILAVILVADLCLKDSIEHQEDNTFPRPLPCCKKYITVYKSHNEGLPFGFLKRNMELVFMIPAMIASAVAGIFTWLLFQKGHIVEKTALAAILGGAISNLYDRIIRKYVVDYFSINIGFFKKIIFNIGDICILTGSLAFVIISIIRDLKRR